MFVLADENNEELCYFVKDIIPNDISNVRYIFIFESPHNTEIKTKIPVSGKTGKILLSKIRPYDDENDSFGAFIRKRIKKTKDTVIMNVSNVALQKISEDQRPEKRLEKYAKVRKLYKSAFKHQKKIQDCIGKIEQDILDDFSKRLQVILDKNSEAEIIVCGKFAENYFNQLKEEKKYIFMPHPAQRGGWNGLNEKQIEILEELKTHYID